jgi:hypothetical protein
MIKVKLPVSYNTTRVNWPDHTMQAMELNVPIGQLYRLACKILQNVSETTEAELDGEGGGQAGLSHAIRGK